MWLFGQQGEKYDVSLPADHQTHSYFWHSLNEGTIEGSAKALTTLLAKVLRNRYPKEFIFEKCKQISPRLIYISITSAD